MTVRRDCRDRNETAKRSDGQTKRETVTVLNKPACRTPERRNETVKRRKP